MTIDFNRLWSEIDKSVGVELSIEGQLLINGVGAAFLSSDQDTYGRGKFIWLLDNFKISNFLIQCFPAYGGGEFIYADTATVTGTLVKIEDRIVLRDINWCRVVRDEYDIEIPGSIFKALQSERSRVFPEKQGPWE